MIFATPTNNFTFQVIWRLKPKSIFVTTNDLLFNSKPQELLGMNLKTGGFWVWLNFNITILSHRMQTFQQYFCNNAGCFSSEYYTYL